MVTLRIKLSYYENVILWLCGWGNHRAHLELLLFWLIIYGIWWWDKKTNSPGKELKTYFCVCWKVLCTRLKRFSLPLPFLSLLLSYSRKRPYISFSFCTLMLRTPSWVPKNLKIIKQFRVGNISNQAFMKR